MVQRVRYGNQEDIHEMNDIWLNDERNFDYETIFWNQGKRVL
jgi:hypothetical protein